MEEQKKYHPKHPKYRWIWHVGNVVWATIPGICMIFGFIILCFLAGIRKRTKLEEKIQQDQIDHCNIQEKVHLD